MIMNYEQKYKEALERARKMKQENDTFVRVTPALLEEIFPELKECEDERIRKGLIDLIYKVYANTNYITCVEHEKMLAWLEKQGELSEMVDALTESLERANKQLEKQGEQKDGYDNTRVNLSNFCGEIRQFSDLLEDMPKPYWDGWYEALEWVRTHGSPFKEQTQSAEWSEEDEEMLSNIIDDYDEHDELVDGIGKVTWLKSLLPQPHWKPTEDQLEALDWVIATTKDKDYNNILDSLYKDLENLI